MEDAAPSLRVRVAGVAAALGGLLWIGYGVFEFLPPWGIDAVYDDDRGYEVVVDRMRFTLYTAPGALALLLTSLCLLEAIRQLRTARGHSARAGFAAGLLAAAAGLASCVGVAIAFDPVATGMRIAGSLLLGVAAVLGARAAVGSGRRYVLLLGCLGAGSLFLLPLWPLVYAVEMVPATAGASVFAMLGLGWVYLGLLLLLDSTHRRSSR